MGRGPLDSAAVEQIQASHPDLEFDWPRILKGQPEPEPSSESSASGDRAPRRERRSADRSTPRPPQAEPERRRQPRPEAPAPESGAAVARLGAEGIARLRSRYREMAARLRSAGEGGLDISQLKPLAERLNPDAWGTDEAVSEALDSYEQTFEQVRSALNGRRRTADSGPESQPEGGNDDEKAPV